MFMGFPVVNLGVELLSWKLEGDSTEAASALRVCGEKIVRDFCSQQTAPLAILEPSMSVEFRVEGQQVARFFEGATGL